MEPLDETDVGQKRRSDFELNRKAILAAADETFAELGVSASIATIASRAGVGAATVYRHFSNREALVAAVFDLRVAAYADAIEEAQLAADPEAAFRDSIHAIVDLQTRDRGFREMFGERDTIPTDNAEFARFGEAILGVFMNARAGGVLRDDVSDEDVFLFLLACEGIARPASRQSTASVRRLVDFALDGFCGTRTQLEGEPLTWEQLFGISGR